MADPYRILLVEDDPPQAKLIVEFLCLEDSFKVDWVDRLDSLWEKLAHNFYHITLMDYRLPDGNGLDALINMRKGGYLMPVVMITGQGDERIAAQSIQSGAADYVVKRGDYFLSLPSIIRRSIHSHELQVSIQHYLEQTQYQAVILNNVRDAVVVWDTDGHVTFWNFAAEMLFGWSMAERLGDHVAVSYLPMFTPSLEYPIRQLDDHEVERQVLTKEQQKIWVGSRITALWDPSEKGNLLGYMDVVRDITERKLMEDKIQAAQTRLIQAARLSAVGELAAGIAHRINNPLTTIIAEAQLLTRSLSASNPGRESIEAIEKAGWKAQEVVQRLIDFSRPAKKSLEFVSVNKTIEHVLILIGAQIQSNGINLLTDLGEDLPLLYGDSSRLENLWFTLLLYGRDLAIEMGSDGLSIKSGITDSQNLVIDVCVNKVTIPEDRLVNIFQPDFTDPYVKRGTGMELSICHEIVTQHQGQINVLNSGNNAVFRVSLLANVENPDALKV